MKKHIRFTAFFLAMVMILSLFTGMASAEEGEIESETNSQTETSETDNTLTLQPIISEDYESFDVLKAPDIMSTAEIQANGYVGRVRSQEKDLYTLVFKNSNGSYTKKIYSHPVKYVDATGVVRDISLEIGENKDGSFSTASHEIITTFKKNPVNGITLDYKDVSIRMVPALTGNKAPAAIRSADNKKITYNLDSTTAYVYELTYAGYKEDIVVKKYTGQTEYMFKLYTNGLTLTKINETYCLTDSEGEIKATVGDVIIFTADERNNTFGSMTYQTVRQNQEYIITIHVDADYLKDPKTVYPIRIDPTIEIRYSNNGAGAIEDVTINSNAGSDGSSTSLLIGKRNTYGISRVLLKVPALTFDAIPYAASITSATIAIRDIMCQSSSLDIYCHKFLGGTWTESTASWSSVNPNSYGSYLDMHTVSYSNGVAQPTDHSYAFDITYLVREWYSSSSAQNMGVIFKAADEVENASAHNHKTFGSYSSSYRPVFTLVYEEYTSAIAVTPASVSLTEGETAQISASTNLSGATISWSSSNSAVATYNASTGRINALKAGTATITATARTGDGLTYSASCEVSVYIPDGTYFLKNKQVGYCADILNSMMTSGTTICQWKYTGNSTQKWIFTRQSDGYYTIRSANSITVYYLSVKDDANTKNADIVLSNGPITNGTKWAISVTDSGAYRLTPKTGDWCLATNTSSQTNGTKLIQGEYVYNTSYRDEWYISLYDISLIALPENYDRSSYFPRIIEDMNSIGYVLSYNNHATVNQGMTESELLEYMKQSKITLIRSHGTRDGIEVSDGVLTRSDIRDLPTNTLSYSDLIIYGSCLTGEWGASGVNLVTQTVRAGARTVIGFKNSISADVCNKWCEIFFEYYAEHYDNTSYMNICIEADNSVKKHPDYEPYYEDGELVYNFTIAGKDDIPR